MHVYYLCCVINVCAAPRDTRILPIKLLFLGIFYPGRNEEYIVIVSLFL